MILHAFPKDCQARGDSEGDSHLLLKHNDRISGTSGNRRKQRTEGSKETTLGCLIHFQFCLGFFFFLSFLHTHAHTCDFSRGLNLHFSSIHSCEQSLTHPHETCRAILRNHSVLAGLWPREQSANIGRFLECPF